MKNITKKLYQFIKPYLEMEINGIVINCPYWMNKIKDGRIIRGFGNGKAEVIHIKEKLKKEFNGSNLYKLAKRHRTGIDCSGFVYRMLNHLIPALDSFFPGGINRTNAAKLTNRKYAVLINKIDNIKPGDMIRMREGKHIALVIEKKDDKIVYAHSSSSRYTKAQGVHLGEIIINDRNKPLENQSWKEILKDGNNFQLFYYRPENGDGVYRLKWMNL